MNAVKVGPQNSRACGCGFPNVVEPISMPALIECISLWHSTCTVTHARSGNEMWYSMCIIKDLERPMLLWERKSRPTSIGPSIKAKCYRRRTEFGSSKVTVYTTSVLTWLCTVKLNRDILSVWLTYRLSVVEFLGSKQVISLLGWYQIRFPFNFVLFHL